MKKFIFFISIVLLAVIQSTSLHYLGVLGVKPDLMLASVVLVNIIFLPKQAFFLSIFAGILKDGFSVNVFGVNTLLFSLFSLMLIRLNKEVWIEADIIRILLAYLVSLVNYVITSAIIIFFSGIFIPLGIILRTLLIGPLYTTLAFLILFRITQILWQGQKA